MLPICEIALKYVVNLSELIAKAKIYNQFCHIICSLIIQTSKDAFALFNSDRDFESHQLN